MLLVILLRTVAHATVVADARRRPAGMPSHRCRAACRWGQPCLWRTRKRVLMTVVMGTANLTGIGPIAQQCFLSFWRIYDSAEYPVVENILTPPGHDSRPLICLGGVSFEGQL